MDLSDKIDSIRKEFRFKGELHSVNVELTDNAVLFSLIKHSDNKQACYGSEDNPFAAQGNKFEETLDKFIKLLRKSQIFNQ